MARSFLKYITFGEMAMYAKPPHGSWPNQNTRWGLVKPLYVISEACKDWYITWGD